jgi:hypothetical protein
MHRYETGFEGLRLVVDVHASHCDVFVYDPDQCEVLYTGQRMNLEMAKLAAIEFGALIRFGPQHDLKASVLAEMLAWAMLSI